jgi:hypothetical protein
VAGITTNTPILTLNVKGSTPPSKDSLANWNKKEDPTICGLQETHFIEKTNTGLR